MVHDGRQPASRELRQLVRREEAFEQQDPARIVRGAQRDRRVELDQREAVGYGATYRAPVPHRLGIVACGYADGYPRHARNGTPVLVCGKQAPLAGRVSMDMLTVDLTGVPEARVGSPVVLWGEGLPVDDVAYMAGTVGYELLCAVTPRVPFVVSNVGRLDLEL